ncbi:MAG TPA: mechanosensitive ion channel family protein [SAR86 cluster bacterium]|jgi:MscS family membrane protein|nr:mechanosensitive ion channel family protein [SAR86 cluster bacterium]HJM59827.1 mechanosensitive ion channel family protein [SAR86 cluster bacterium]|tara:strand:- start:4149 stop:5237 length:1089 start_codon:yes stop_codon:yes gene_type:complete
MIIDFWKLIVETWETGIRGIGIDDILICLAIIIGSLVFRSLFNTYLIDKIAKFTENSETTVDDEIVESLRGPFGLVPIAFGLYLITSYLPLSGSLDLIATNLVKMIVIYTIFSAFSNLTRPLLSSLGEKSWLTPAMSTWLSRVCGVLIWVVGITMMLDIWGIEIGPIIAGLGLFSVAVALGAQDMFKNIIAGIFIISEKRFQPGDRIRLGDGLHGIVETIGFRSTQVRLLDTSPVFVPNTDLSDSQVTNHQDMRYRRLFWTINLVYSSTAKQLESICKDIQDYINSMDGALVNPGQENFVKVSELGSSSIDLTILCYLEVVSYTEFSQIKQDLIFKIMEVVESHGSDFAFPSRSIYIENQSD